MDYEKKYKEALEAAKKLYQDCPNGKNDRLYHTTDLEKIFPELAESEDEMIRKRIIALVNAHGQGMYKDDMLAWLEKQKPIILTGDDLSTLKNWVGYIQDKASELELNDWFVEATEKVVNKMKTLLIQHPNIIPKEMDVDDTNFWLEKQGEQKPAWSEEDEKEYKYVLKFVDNILNNYGNKKDYEHCKRCYDWLKSLKDRVLPQNTWKPSDGQITVLELASKYERVFTPKQIDILIGLKEQLKKLREE